MRKQARRKRNPTQQKKSLKHGKKLQPTKPLSFSFGASNP